LVSEDQQVRQLFEKLVEIAHATGCKYVEFRPTYEPSAIPSDFQKSEQFYLHRLDLRPGASALFTHLHRDSIQRKIRKAERERLTLQKGRSSDLIRDFYALTLRTRRRHGLPPQPLSWFRNLADCLGEVLLIRVAYKGDKAIAGMLTLEHQTTLTYKYGASDERFHNLGGMPLLFWHAIQDAATRGFEQMDMGRSEINNEGLATFRERWGAKATPLVYWKAPAIASRALPPACLRLAHYACSHIPDMWLRAIGALVYRHAA
jgi:lipid II:glycine glycyltransferase (peptidoglycan interpeptide bridge formation enzyme)